LSRLDIRVDRLVVKALTAARPGPGDLLRNAGTEAGLNPDEALSRACACFLNFAAFNLADDVSDAECDYLAADETTTVLLILNNLFYSQLRHLDLPRGIEEQILSDLISAEESQAIEVMTTSWNARQVCMVTDGIAGRQWSAYLHLMWSGTASALRAEAVARDLGRSVLLAGDINSRDVRYTSLPVEDRRELLDSALDSVRALESSGLHFCDRLITTSRETITEELASLDRSADTRARPA
jgi:hypothetical protein